MTRHQFSFKVIGAQSDPPAVNCFEWGATGTRMIDCVAGLKLKMLQEFRKQSRRHINLKQNCHEGVLLCRTVI
jgi:hypothetical protein